MNLESFREYCFSKKGITEELPFGPDVLVFKVMGKMFALTALNADIFRISLKNLPEKNEELRAEHSFIEGAYHMNKKHWNMILIDYSVKDSFIKEMIDESYLLIIESLPKKVKEEFYQL